MAAKRMRVRENPLRGRCTAEECQRYVFARSWCQKHYRRWHSTGSVTLPTVEDRFWRKVNKTSADCWTWTAGTRNGYGTFRFKERHEYTHRVAYQLTFGEIPEGLVVRHRCDNRLCVRPEHLELGTKADNSRDMVERGRSPRNPRALNTHCLSGHPYDEANTYRWNGARQCRTCKQQDCDRRRMRRKPANT